MKRKPRPESARTRERAAQRTQDRWVAERERLFALEAGGSSQRPLEVASASVVEAHALAVACPRCLGPHELVEHAAVALHGVRLREARLCCRQCGVTRSMFFRLRIAAPN